MVEGKAADAQCRRVDLSERFAAFYEAHYGKALALVRLRASGCDGEALVADAFEVAWRHLKAGGDLGAGWFYQVVRHKIGDFYRSAGQRESSTSLEGMSAVWVCDDADRVDLRVEVRRVLLGMPLCSREPLFLVHWLDLSRAEAAQAMGIREGAFRVRLHRAHQAFLREFAGERGDVTSRSRREVVAWIERNG